MNLHRLLIVALGLLLVLHQDFWNWDQLVWRFGLPSGFLFHIGFCLAVSLVMALLVRVDRPASKDPED